MNNSPFSPFVGRNRTLKEFKRRQSELPSDLIDWDAPEIPELDKQRIIYEEYIKECTEDHAIETLINQEIFNVAHEVSIEAFQKLTEDKLQKERAQVNLLLGQLKMFENHSQEQEATIKELENQIENLRKELESQSETIEQQLEKERKTLEKQLEEQREDLEKQQEEQAKEYHEHVQALEAKIIEQEEQIKDHEFRIKELEADNSCQLDTILLKKAESEDLKRKLDSAKNQLTYYKKLSKKG